MENLYIDPEAKFPVRLIKVKDASGNPYFIGKLQFPGTMELERGASFMVFTAEDGYEELQIAPIDPARRSKISSGATLNKAKLCIDLHAMVDRNGATYYVGEVMGLSKIDMFVGIFFTIFTSIPGQEQLQMSKLQAKPRPRFDDAHRTNTFNPRHFTDHT